jgi:predicted ribosomally synthesized peptide with nif11-like leader
MAAKTAQDLIKRLSTDVVFRQRLENATSKDEKRSIIESEGFTAISAEDVKTAAASGEFELSDAELEAVAGGRTASWVESVSTVVGAIATAAVALL